MILIPREASGWCEGEKKELTRSNSLKHDNCNGKNLKQVCVHQIFVFSPHIQRNGRFSYHNNHSATEALTFTDTELIAKLWIIEFQPFPDYVYFFCDLLCHLSPGR